jgi:phospho-N-acetylmuramoyl-pentapeptide-transferase
MFYLGVLFGCVLGYGLLVFTAPAVLGSWASRSSVSLYICVLTALCFGLVGFVDDYIKVVKKRNLGLMARYKIIAQIFITAAFLASMQLNGTLNTVVTLPLFGAVNFGYWYYPISFLLIIGMVNAVNLTDGIDGLASCVTFVAMLGFMVVSSLLGKTSTALFAAAVAGGCAGFLAWNFYPAKVFMGDTGSMFLGGAVVACAYSIGRPELLLFFGFIYLVEAGSVMLQVSYFKLTHGKRIFKMSPIHHHFEMCGWSEVKIDAIFSLVTAACVLLGCLFVYMY